jgi:hypothetical protein
MDIPIKLDTGAEDIGLCPHCGQHGLASEIDVYGSYLECIYCGYCHDLQSRTCNIEELNELMGG